MYVAASLVSSAFLPSYVPSCLQRHINSRRTTTVWQYSEEKPIEPRARGFALCRTTYVCMYICMYLPQISKACAAHVGSGENLLLLLLLLLALYSFPAGSPIGCCCGYAVGQLGHLLHRAAYFTPYICSDVWTHIHTYISYPAPMETSWRSHGRRRAVGDLKTTAACRAPGPAAGGPYFHELRMYVTSQMVEEKPYNLCMYVGGWSNWHRHLRFSCHEVGRGPCASNCSRVDENLIVP